MDAFRRRVRVSERLLSGPSRPERTNLFGERTGALVRVSAIDAAPLVRDKDDLKLLEGTDGLIGLFRAFEPSEGLIAGARLATAAGRDRGKPALVGYRLGEGIVVRVGVPEWAEALDDGEEEALVTRRIFGLISR